MPGSRMLCKMAQSVHTLFSNRNSRKGEDDIYYPNTALSNLNTVKGERELRRPFPRDLSISQNGQYHPHRAS